jgi:hypothetical protein
VRFSTGYFGERLRNLPNRDVSIVVALVLALIFTNNVFHFSQYRINRVFDQTSEGMVVGRLGRSAADGIFSQRAELGMNFLEKDPPEVRGNYPDQIKYFEHPELIKTDGAGWAVYPSQFGLQGIVLALIDSIDPLPRRYRIGFYHFLSALMCAAAFMWVAYKIRDRFGFAAATGFVVPVMFEPMFTALAPNLYWAVGLWFVPMAIAMDIAGAESRRRKWWLIAATGAAVFAKSLCGYEFITTVIVAAMIGCLLNTRNDPFPNIIDMVWVAASGIIGFALAILVHGAKLGFAIILDRAIDRTTAVGTTLQDGLIMGQFASVASVIRLYLGANDYTQIRSFGLVFGLLAAIAVTAFLDRQFSWFLGEDHTRLRALAFAFVASFAAPMSWFILAKAHSFAHPPIDFILWYVPTLPVGGAMAGLAFSQAVAARKEWSASFARSFLTLAIPAMIVVTVALVFALDGRIDSKGTWVLQAHAHGTRLFADADIGVDLHMTDTWFTVEYACDRTSPSDVFLLRTTNAGAETNYDFRLVERSVTATANGKCYYAQAKSRSPFTRLEVGFQSGRRIEWHREIGFTVRDAFTTDALTDANWDHGLLRSTGKELLLKTDDFLPLSLHVGDVLEFAASGPRKLASVDFSGPYVRLQLEGAPLTAEDAKAPVGIVRQP